MKDREQYAMVTAAISLSVSVAEYFDIEESVLQDLLGLHIQYKYKRKNH